MKLTIKYLNFVFLLAICTTLHAQEDTVKMAEPSEKENVKFHVGLMQMIFSIRDGEVRDLSLYDYYSLGLPVGVTVPVKGRLSFDMEVVAFIRPYFENPDRAVEIELLFHPGFLIKLGSGFSAGLRAAAEINSSNYGFTPLLNKSFALKSGNAVFVELLLPGRFDPEKSGIYTQEFGIHAGFSF